MMHGTDVMWPMGAMMFGWVLLTVLLVGAAVWLLVRDARPVAGDDGSSARRLLDERYARGELDTDEYHQRRAALR
ncbi:SHOCT domain-containing protein [Micromonospora coxensis]|uniref:SHOCT domain-containing protein n=1 Tax=Micromonospora coxensis TaxID=356852 RepID=UPI00342B897B